MSPAPTRFVLDTNVVLDCLVFDDPATRELMAAVQARRVCVLVHPCTLDELARVLAYPQLRLDANAQRDATERYTSVATLAETPDGFARDALLLPSGFPRCRDRDDEPFLALAYHTGADALVTKDKAVLKLGRKAQRFGVAIRSPADIHIDR